MDAILPERGTTFTVARAVGRSGLGGRPVEVFSEHFILCFIDDAVGVGNSRTGSACTGSCGRCDYPHPDTMWPESPEWLAKNLAGCGPADVAAITHLNACGTFIRPVHPHSSGPGQGVGPAR